MRGNLLSRSHRQHRRFRYPLIADSENQDRFFEGGWSKAGGNISNDQIVLGSELITNGDFSAWTGDDPDSWVVAENVPNTEISQVGAGQGHGGAGTGLLNEWRNGAGGASDPRVLGTGTVTGEWHRVTIDIDTINSGQLRIRNVSAIMLATYTTIGSKQFSGLEHNDTRIQISTNADPTDATVDNISSKQFIFTSIINTLKSQFGLADGFFIEADIENVVADSQIGFIWNRDGNNFSIVMSDMDRLGICKSVAGVYTPLVADVAQAITPGQTLRIENPAGSNVINMLYNGVSKATPTISDAGIISNTGIALFSTDALNSISKVTIGRL